MASGSGTFIRGFRDLAQPGDPRVRIRVASSIVIMQKALLAVSAVFAVACQASAGAQLDAKSSGDIDATADARLTTAQDDQAAAAQLSSSAGVPAETSTASPSGTEAMLGARQGLRPKDPASLSPTCKCLKVTLGSANDSVFVWDGPISQMNPDTQLAIGLTSEALTCPEAASDSLGASYHGYQVSGNDVFVEVETARLGRPIIRGAIIPRPITGGRIVVLATDPQSPYGRSLDGGARECVVWTAR